MCTRLSNSIWYSWILLWFHLCDLGWASRRLDFCTAEADFSLNVSGSGSGSSNDASYPHQMPLLLHFQTHSSSSVRTNYAWSTVGFPTLFLSQTFDSRSCKDVSLNEEDFIKSQEYGSVDIPGADSNMSMAVVFRRIILYDGGNSFKAANGFNASMTIPDPVNENVTRYPRSVYLNESIMWQYYPKDRRIVGTFADLRSLAFKFVLPSKEENRRISYFPKTMYTPNSTVVDVTIDRFNFTGTKNGRVAIEMIMINGQPVTKSSTKVTAMEDDEYTPSVFRTWEYYFRKAPIQAFMQWKPVSYQTKNRKSTKSQQANIVYPNGLAVDFLGSEVPRGLASAVFNDTTPLNGTAMYIVIGNSGDETYVNSRYQTWTFLIGFGDAPRDKISLKVIIIITVALGVPAILIFVGSFYVTYKKKPWLYVTRGVKRLRGVDGYERIQ